MAEGEVYQVQGKVTQSNNEYYVSVALDELVRAKVIQDYEYQKILGNPQASGFYKIDFVVYTPHAEPLEIMEEYWHSGSLGSGDKHRLNMIKGRYRREVEILYGHQTDTLEVARQSVRELYVR